MEESRVWFENGKFPSVLPTFHNKSERSERNQRR
jgi:hypothetical protein